MKITRCKLSKKNQVKLLEFLLRKLPLVQPLIYYKYSLALLLFFTIKYGLWQTIIYPKKQANYLTVKSNESKAILAVYAKANKVEVQGVTSLYLVILKRQGQVYTLVVDDTKANTLIPII